MHEDFFYVKQKNLADGWISYECERRRLNNTCKGKIKVNGENIVVSRHHTHQPDPIRRDVLRIRDNLRNRAEYSRGATTGVIKRPCRN